MEQHIPYNPPYVEIGDLDDFGGGGIGPGDSLVITDATETWNLTISQEFDSSTIEASDFLELVSPNSIHLGVNSNNTTFETVASGITMATDGTVDIQAQQAVAIRGDQGTTINVGTPAGSVFLVHVDGGNDALTWTPGDFNLEVDSGGVGSNLLISTDNINISAGGDDSSVSITSGGGGTNTITITAANGGFITFDCGGMGFFGSGPAPRPQVPASPTVQDVVDALVQLGLITQAP